MKIIHSINDQHIERDIADEENVSFLLTNGLGGYAAFAKNNDSRYNGWFVSLERKVYKIIDEIRFSGEAKIVKINNNFYEAERFFENGFSDSMFMPRRLNSLVYELDKETDFEIVLDIREPYDSRNFGKNYEIFEEDGLTIVKYSKNKNWEEDKSDGKEYEMFLAIRADGGKIEKIGTWEEKHYEYDEQRMSQPFRKHVYKALKINAKKIVVSAALEKETAKSEALDVYKKTNALRSEEAKRLNKVMGTLKIDGKKTTISYFAAKNSLASLLVRDGKKFGVYAGLPWFFQFWTSDEAICLKSISRIDKDLAKKTILRDINYINSDGKTYDIIDAKKFNQYTLNMDAAGWLFKRAGQMVREGILNEDDIKTKIISVIESLRKNYIKDGFAYVEAGETWMDTFFAGDVRDGVRIEIQALMLSLYKEAFEITKDVQYKIWEAELLKKVREKFWNGKILADGLNDLTIRPNIFIAYYIYPELLDKSEWKICFKEALDHLWLDWGGLATIDKSSPFFCNEYTGEMPVSYHRGDSWYWINNLAALALYEVDAHAFKDYASKILKASSEELLWHGALGHISELSSAKEQRSEGAWAQAWSAAMYMEAVEEIMKEQEVPETIIKTSHKSKALKSVSSQIEEFSMPSSRHILDCADRVISKPEYPKTLKPYEVVLAILALFSLVVVLILIVYLFSLF